MDKSSPTGSMGVARRRAKDAEHLAAGSSERGPSEPLEGLAGADGGRGRDFPLLRVIAAGTARLWALSSQLHSDLLFGLHFLIL